MRHRWPWVAVDTAARRVVADRSGGAVMIGFYVIVVSVLGALWRAAADANGGAVAGYSGAALTWYVVASEATTVSLNLRLIEEIGDDIASGAVSTELLRPVPALWVRLATQAGRGLSRLAACVAVGVVLAVLTVGAPPKLAAAALAIPALGLAILCNLAAQHAFAATAFWVRDARSMWFLYQKLVFVLGGMLLPLEVLPGAMQAVALRLPFMAMSYVPARLASGHLDAGLIVVQVFWLVFLSLVARAMFGAGERKLQVVGG